MIPKEVKEQARWGKVFQAKRKVSLMYYAWWVQGKARRPVWLERNESRGRIVIVVNIARRRVLISHYKGFTFYSGRSH